MAEVLTFAVVFLAAFTQSVVSFGFGLVTMAFLPLFLDERYAIPFVAVYSLLISLLIIWPIRREVSWPRAVPLLVGTLLGVPLGLGAIMIANPVHIYLVLGLTLVVYTAWALFFRPSAGRELHLGWGYLAGLTSGILGAFNTGGPPAVVYTTLNRWPKDLTSATLQVTFILTVMIQLVGFTWNGMLTPGVLFDTLVMAPALLLGAVLGRLVYRRIDELTFKRVVLVVLFGVGVVYLYKVARA